MRHFRSTETKLNEAWLDSSQFIEKQEIIQRRKLKPKHGRAGKRKRSKVRHSKNKQPACNHANIKQHKLGPLGGPGTKGCK